MTARNLTYATWLTAIVATLGSLYFSDVMHLPPCVLCWYQRIFLYPLAILVGIGIWQKDPRLPTYVLPLSIIGLGIALYHNLLYYHILPESAAPCSAGVSCTIKLIEWFGFITIPLLSLAAFTIMTVLMLIVKRKESRAK